MECLESANKEKVSFYIAFKRNKNQVRKEDSE